MKEFTLPDDRPWFRYWPEDVPKSLEYPDVPLFAFLERAAEMWPDSPAFSFGEKSLTYAELDDLTGRLAAGLADQGMKPGDVSLLIQTNSLEFVIGYYGILKAGGTVNPVNPMSRQAELRHQLNDTGAVAVITGSEYYPLVREVQPGSALKTVICTDAGTDGQALSLDQVYNEYPNKPPQVNIKPEDVAAIVYTGGTTGGPKGVLLSHANLVANAMQNAAWFNWGREETVIGLLPFYHSWGACACVNSPITSGARVVIIGRFDADSLLGTIERERATVMYGASSMFTSLVNSPAIGKYDLSSLKYVKSGAMPTPPEVRERWERLTGVSLVLGYGLSEASPETHNSPLRRIRPGTIGIPVCDTDARIVDEETGEKDMPPGESGELVIRGPQVMRGYLNRPEETAEALRSGWLYTGDLAVMDEEGYFHALDRKKETIKYKGYTIAPAEVEAVLYEHPAVRECAVIGKPDELCGEIPKAFIVLRPDHNPSEEELIEFCALKISPYKRIRAVEFIDEIPKTPVGKLLRRILRDRERSRDSG